MSEDKLTTDVWQIDYQFSGTYTDPVLNLAFPVTIVITLSRVANGTSFVVARAYATGGSQFKNHSPSSLQSRLSSSAVPPRTRQTSTTSGKNDQRTVWEDIAGATAATLTVTPSMVDSFAMFKCSILDTDATSDTSTSATTPRPFRSWTSPIPTRRSSSPPREAISRTTREAPPSSAECIRTARRSTDRGESHLHMDQDRQGRTAVAFTPTAVAHGSIVTTKKKAISVSHDDVTVKATYSVRSADQKENTWH